MEFPSSQCFITAFVLNLFCVVLPLFFCRERLNISVNLSGNPIVWCFERTLSKYAFANLADLKIRFVDISVWYVNQLWCNNFERVDFCPWSNLKKISIQWLILSRATLGLKFVTKLFNISNSSTLVKELSFFVYFLPAKSNCFSR